jgi:hypothetical protein
MQGHNPNLQDAKLQNCARLPSKRWRPKAHKAQDRCLDYSQKRPLESGLKVLALETLNEYRNIIRNTTSFSQ